MLLLLAILCFVAAAIHVHLGVLDYPEWIALGLAFMAAAGLLGGSLAFWRRSQ